MRWELCSTIIMKFHSKITHVIDEERLITRGSLLSKIEQIIGMGLKEFLSNIKTKHDITIYLSNKCHTLFNNLEVFYLVSVNSTTSGNIDAPLNDNHEEVDTCIIWYCIHATNQLSGDHDTAIIVWTPDSDAVPLLVRFHDKIVPRLYMQTSLHCIDINSIVSSLGSKAKALSSLHSLSGCDTTGKFITKVKQNGWRFWVYVMMIWLTPYCHWNLTTH